MSDSSNAKNQLLVYHIMFGPDWEEGCPSCSFWADNLDGVGPIWPTATQASTTTSPSRRPPTNCQVWARSPGRRGIPHLFLLRPGLDI